MSTKLFGNNISPACQYCERALRVLSNNQQVLCEKYGVVRADHHCRHFVYDPLLRIPAKPRSLQSFSKKDFLID